MAGQPAAGPGPAGGRGSGPENGREGRRAEVLRLLKAAGAPLSIADIAQQLDVHPNTVRFHLNTLVSSGLAERVPPEHSRAGRPPLLFRAVRRMNPAGPRRYRLLAEILVQSLAAGPDPARRAAEAGSAWGRQLASRMRSGAPNRPGHGAETGRVRPEEPARRLVWLLDELGFAPHLRVTDEGVQVDLRHCPFLELAQARAQVVCPVHLGLMRGAMDAWDAPVTVDRLEAFAQPDLCVAHLAAAETTA
jgi:predicted ArsR family transcriptional regulator